MTRRWRRVYRNTSHASLSGLLVGLGLLLFLHMPGCGSASQQSVTQKIAAGVRTAHEATNAARDAYLTAQRTAEAAVVAAAPNEAAGIEALARLDTARAPVLRAFAVAYSALARAEALIEPAKIGRSDIGELIQAAIDVAHAVDGVYVAVSGK